MAPTLSPAHHETGATDTVVIKRWEPARGLQRGDIITFWKPHKPDEISIKRVVAFGGDTVWPRDREAMTRGHAHTRANYDLGGKKCLVVPYGHMWVEGDNWRESFDSNDFGPISKGLIDGKAVGVVRGWRIAAIPEKRVEKGSTRVAIGKEQLPEIFLPLNSAH